MAIYYEDSERLYALRVLHSHRLKATADIKKTLVDIAVKRGWDHDTQHDLTHISLFLGRTSGNDAISSDYRAVVLDFGPGFRIEGLEEWDMPTQINYPASAEQLCRMLTEAEAALPTNATTPMEYYSRKSRFERDIDTLMAVGLTEEQAEDVARAMVDLSRYNASASGTMKASLRVGEHECSIREWQTRAEEKRVVDWLLC